jgi:heme/copper-type cytochrome/quinol oxidase subunit 1
MVSRLRNGLAELFALPVGVVVLCLLATVWRGSIWARLPLFFVYLFLWDLVIGGVSGALLGNPTTDRSFHGGMVVTAHLHFMMVGAVLVGAAGGLVYWFPKFTGRMLDERSGRGAFWLIAFGIQLTFLAQFWAGAEGMARRVAWYEPGFQTANQISTVGAYLLTLGWVVLVWAGVWSARHGRPAPADPWRARTLEWRTPTPVPLRNFPVAPVLSEDPEATYSAWTDSSTPGAVPVGGHSNTGAGRPSAGETGGED